MQAEADFEDAPEKIGEGGCMNINRLSEKRTFSMHYAKRAITRICGA